MKKYDKESSEPLAQEEHKEDQSSEDVRRSSEDDNGTQNSTDDENPVWDGTESEFIEDDDAAVYEEKYTGVKLNYALKASEIFVCLKNFSEYKKKRKKVIVQTVILILLIISFLVTFIKHEEISSIILGSMCVIMLAVIWIVPDLIIRSHAKQIAKGDNIYVEIFPDEIVVGHNGIEKTVLLDGTCRYIEYSNMFIIFPPKDDMIIIPIRAVEPDFLPDVEAMLLAGTLPYQE